MNNRCRALLATMLLLAMSGSSVAESPPPPPPAAGLSLASLTVQPAAPTADTLCRLRVEIQNSGTQPASHLVFRVRVAGKDLRVYDKLVTLQTLPVGAKTEVRLYNFWSSETGRPYPADGDLTVEVSLLEARWVRVESKDGEEVITPVGPVGGLPISRSITLRAAPAK
jgi:hypothetical protein